MCEVNTTRNSRTNNSKTQRKRTVDSAMNINDRIKELRTQRNVTQGQLGDVLGIGQKAVSLIEKGINKPSVQQVETLSRYFGVSIDYLVTGVDVKVTPVENELLGLIRGDANLMQSLTAMLNAKKSVLNRLSA